MTLDVLKRLRNGLASGDFTATQVAQVSGIPLTTLLDMKEEGWSTKAIERLADLEAALDRIKQDSSRPKKGKAIA